MTRIKVLDFGPMPRGQKEGFLGVVTSGTSKDDQTGSQGPAGPGA